MAIKIDEKKKKTSSLKGVEVLFRFGLGLVVVTVLSYFFITFLIIGVEETKQEIRQAIEAKKAEIPEKPELERVAQEYFHLVEDFKLVVENHKTMSPLFSPFEKAIHPKVSVTSMNLNTTTGEGQIVGSGDDFVAIGQQFHALKEKEFITSVNLTELRLTEDDLSEKVTFTFSIVIDTELLALQI